MSSQCIDPLAANGGINVMGTGMEGTTTRTDGVVDTGTLEMGYHYAP